MVVLQPDIMILSAGRVSWGCSRKCQHTNFFCCASSPTEVAHWLTTGSLSSLSPCIFLPPPTPATALQYHFEQQQSATTTARAELVSLVKRIIRTRGTHTHTHQAASQGGWLQICIGGGATLVICQSVCWHCKGNMSLHPFLSTPQYNHHHHHHHLHKLGCSTTHMAGAGPVQNAYRASQSMLQLYLK